MSHFNYLSAVKITTWNIRHGGGSRTEAIKAVLDEVQSSDVLVITEFRPNKNADVICAHLESLGFTHQFRTVEEPKKNGVLVASKTPFEGSMDDALADHSHRVAVAQFPGLKLFGCYFPQQKEKQKVFDYLIDACREGDSNVITGDINTGLHYADETGASFYCADALKALNDGDMPDAYRHLHGDKREFTWFSNAGNGFRIDHFMVSRLLLPRVEACHYDHAPRESKASDHSVMTLELLKMS